MTIHKDPPTPRQDAKALRQERVWLLARHDSGALSPSTFAVVKQLETEISWLEIRVRP